MPTVWNCPSCNKETYKELSDCPHCGSSFNATIALPTPQVLDGLTTVPSQKPLPNGGMNSGLVLAFIWCLGYWAYILVVEPFGYRISGKEWGTVWAVTLIPAFALLFVGNWLRNSLFPQLIANHVVASATGTVENWSMQTQEKELQKFVNAIEAMDAEEIGMSVAFVVDFRNRLLNEEYIDLYEPASILAFRPGIILDLTQRVATLQKEGNNAAALPLIVWAHSLRAINTLELRMLGRNLWEQLERGFKYVEDAAENVAALTGEKLDIADAGKFPKGLTPKPLN